jgi:hypothetical protein
MDTLGIANGCSTEFHDDHTGHLSPPGTGVPPTGTQQAVSTSPATLPDDPDDSGSASGAGAALTGREAPVLSMMETG